ncbi:MAG: SDR family oxidoreductase [Candidatus Omnitrophota bacterium]
MKNVLLTGGTGFLGWEMAKTLLKDPSIDLFMLARSQKGKGPEERVRDLIKKDYPKYEQDGISKRIEIIDGDITQPNFGLINGRLKALCEKIDTIFHSAALCEFGVAWEKIKKINVDGTENMLLFAIRCNNIKRVNHISTVALAGSFSGIFKEDFLDIGQDFHNTYEMSKFEAEKLCVDFRKQGLEVSIYRPGVITGHYKTGETENFQMFYQFLHILSLELFDNLPVNKHIKYGFVPVDYVARAIITISRSTSNNKVYQLVNPNTISFDDFMDKAVKYFGFKRPLLIPKNQFDFSSIIGFRRKLIDFYLPYMVHEKIDFGMENFTNAINGSTFSWPKVDDIFLEPLFEYCDKIGYIKRKKR